tara:strand:- start:116 stop:292 length:177 start_codon:yes stop_codon:yes gene_type:complete
MLYDVSIEEWQSYLRVQKSGRFNMLDPQAISATGIDKKSYFEIVKHYSEFKDEYGAKC